MKNNILFFCFLTCLIILGCGKSDNDVVVVVDDEIEVFDFTISSMSPEQGKVGDTITISGTNFSSISSENTVTFDGVSASVISATPSTLEVAVPQLPNGNSTVSLNIQDISKTVGAFSVSLDDYKYIAVANNRTVYTIGNISGETLEIGSISHSGSMAITPHTLCNTATKIYGITTYYLADNLQLLVYDKVTGQTSEIALELPNSIVGPNKAISALVWNEQSSVLTGLLNPNEYASEPEYHVINIDPNTFEVIDTGIVTPASGQYILSVTMSNNKLYYGSTFIDSDYERDMVEIDLNANTASLYYFNNFEEGTYRLSKSTEPNKLLAVRLVNSTTNIIPVEIDLIQNTIVDLTPDNDYVFVHVTGKSFHDPNINQSVNVIGNHTIGYSLYKFNDSSHDVVDLNLITGNYFSLYIVGIME
ncbi:IPT/TIG domain-containing protein [Ulvibacter antarcticus]|uniref:IPT/TIG domain-containing protein n=1 Tax=Ulvibacter antarcticus TaxID=442714 RepID=A0A3L9Z460_9FLAO|nr:IPT/TIG domain-containing protein [Ulvibacter antarcticus]RMA66219.1 IPT/TIG domain-containing protein [Ulvibacter antarcticus]